MTMPRTCRLALVVALLAAITNVLAAPSYACACGAAIAPPGAQATMNHEVALVHWDVTTETIVMQLALNATTDNVALVVPTPTPPTVAAGDNATFQELNSLTAPRTQHQRRGRGGVIPAIFAAREGGTRPPGPRAAPPGPPLPP